jgi:glucose/arabinose dehydrogenase
VISLHRLVQLLCFTWICSFSAITSGLAATLPAGFQEVLVASGLRRPTTMTFAPDGRLVISEQDGALRVVKNGALLSFYGERRRGGSQQ